MSQTLIRMQYRSGFNGPPEISRNFLCRSESHRETYLGRHDKANVNPMVNSTCDPAYHDDPYQDKGWPYNSLHI